MNTAQIHIIHRFILFAILFGVLAAHFHRISGQLERIETVQIDYACLAYAAEINARAIAQGRTEPCPDADEAVGLTVKGGAA